MSMNELIGCPFCGGNITDTIDEVIAERDEARAERAEAVAVKPLEWRDLSFNDDFLWTATHAYGDYRITKEAEEWPFVVRPFLTKQSNYQTFEEARADVDADYEQRIRSALVSAPAAEAEPYLWVKEYPAVFDPQHGGEPASTDFFDKPVPGAFPLYRHAAPSPSQEALREALAVRALTRIVEDNYDSWMDDQPADFKIAVVVKFTLGELRALAAALAQSAPVKGGE